MTGTEKFEKKTYEMIDIIKSYGLNESRIFNAMRKIPRHIFVKPEYYEDAYGNHPLPIGYGQTISQPYTVAFMLSALDVKDNHNVLEIGAGSGYNAALLKILAKNGRVTALEIIPQLAKTAGQNISKLNLDIEIICSDGSMGFEKNAPYDRIIISCACPDVSEKIKSQLKEDGIIVAPVGIHFQKMLRLRKKKLEKNAFETEMLGNFSFVPMRGKSGFK